MFAVESILGHSTQERMSYQVHLKVKLKNAQMVTNTSQSLQGSTSTGRLNVNIHDRRKHAELYQKKTLMISC